MPSVENAKRKYGAIVILFKSYIYKLPAGKFVMRHGANCVMHVTVEQLRLRRY